MLAALGATLLVALVPACGARTGLDLEARDAGSRPDGGPTCAPDVTLLPAHADVVLVLDRSGSMSRPLASSAATRWDALRGSLASALPRFQSDVAFGAVVFPTPDATITDGTVCDLGAGLDVPIALGGGPAILAALDAHAPSGGTPTAEALAIAAAALASRRRPGVPQSVVLATDGGPNCDPADRGESWYGQAPETCAESGIDPQLCLDTTRTVAQLRASAVDGAPTYVIAMDVSEPYLVDALRAMAVAGGRPRSSGGEPFYDVRNDSDLAAAFADVATRVSRCSFSPDGVVPDGALTIEVGGVVVPEDDTHVDGWSRGTSGTFDLHGAACARAMTSGVVARIVGACR